MASIPGRTQGKRRLVERALDLANDGRWEEAEQVNREILGRGRPDVAAMNRLGKTLAEQHRYPEALDAYKQALEIDPTNQIADKNVVRLELLSAVPLTAAAKAARPQQARQTMFIEEPGRSATLIVPSEAPRDALARLIPGDHLTLKVEGESVGVYAWDDVFIGYLPARDGQRLAMLIANGNQYQAALAAVTETNVRVVVRETYHSEENGSRLSFPTSGKVAIVPRAYTRDVRRATLDPALYNEDGDDEDDEDDDDLEPDAEDGEITEDEEMIGENRRSSDEDELG